jgi:3-phosphoshikimate 1-carboxyvinyltransferase
MILATRPASSPLTGELTPPGDKSISHRALIFSCLAEGRSRVTGLLESEDVKATAKACRQLGMGIQRQGRTMVLDGVGTAGLSAPQAPLDMGNSGTAMRLLAGVLSAQPFESVLCGDPSLSRRPMTRIVKPLAIMGARIETALGGTPPLRISGNPDLQGIDYQSPIASAQVKSCLLLAGLYASGQTTVTEPVRSRDHTEKMLPAYGVDLHGSCGVSGGSRLTAASVHVPADISSAAFFMVAAAMVPGSDLLLRNVGLNQTRDGIIHLLDAMGADLSIHDQRRQGGEDVGDVRVRYCGRLKAVEIPLEWVPSLIDELPVIMALAAVSNGTTVIRGAAELRVKESDRLAVMAKGLVTLGVALQEYEDGVDIQGGEIQGGQIDGAGDHRCAMSFAVLGQMAAAELLVAGSENINTSYPSFAQDLSRIGGSIEVHQQGPENVWKRA